MYFGRIACFEWFLFRRVRVQFDGNKPESFVFLNVSIFVCSSGGIFFFSFFISQVQLHRVGFCFSILDGDTIVLFSCILLPYSRNQNVSWRLPCWSS